MFLSNLLKLNRKCRHDHVTPDKNCGYCPDCGKFIRNEWYITRCKCCGVKLKTIIKNGEILPQHRYCSNCGGESFCVEKVEQINFIDINFAVLIKRIVENNEIICSTTRCWQEKTYEPPKLTVQY